MSTQTRGKRGGSRPGAGRKRNVQPPQWPIFQIGIVLTDDELRYVQENLTPMQRRYRLVYPWRNLVAGSPGQPAKAPGDGQSRERRRTRTLMRAYDSTGTCRPSNLRVACLGEAEKNDILRLPMPERRLRLLTMPPTGDVVDSRFGKWTRR